MRLATVIEDARKRPYKLGEHDCFRMACASVKALIGIDLWEQWGGRYKTRKGALKLIHTYAGAGFTEAFSKLFGSSPVNPLLARRGDILEYADTEEHLGVCIGARAAVLGEHGLEFVPLSSCRHAWRIG